MKVRKSVKLADDLPNGKDVDKPAVSVEQQSENAADMPNGKGVGKPTNSVIVPRSRDSDKSAASFESSDWFSENGDSELLNGYGNPWPEIADNDTPTKGRPSNPLTVTDPGSPDDSDSDGDNKFARARDTKDAKILFRNPLMLKAMLRSTDNEIISNKFIVRDARRRIENESLDLAWTHYLRRRPLQDEAREVPRGFELTRDQDGELCVLRKGAQNKPVTTLKSVAQTKSRHFACLGPGILMTFRFMRFGAWFFLAYSLVNIPSMAVQGLDPTDPKWVGTAMYADVVFMFALALFMVFLRRDVSQETAVIAKESVTTTAYAIKVENVPKDATADELADYFSQFGKLYSQPSPTHNLFNNDFDRTGVSLTKNDSGMIRTGFDLIELIQEKRELGPENSLGKDALLAKERVLMREMDTYRRKQYEVQAVK
jgi:hypothetical protein